MKNVRYRYLLPLFLRQNLNGFTLIEILAVVIIISILAAIGIPSYLNITDKSRQIEPVIYLKAALKTQQERYSESSEFIETWTELNLSTPETTASYSYTIINLKDDDQLTAGMIANPNNPDLKAFLAGIEPVVKNNNLTFASVICQAKSAGKKFTENNLIKVKKRKLVCTNDSTEVGK